MASGWPSIAGLIAMANRPRVHTNVPAAARVHAPFDFSELILRGGELMQRRQDLEQRRELEGRRLGLEEQLQPGKLSQQGLVTETLESTLGDLRRQRAERGEAPGAIGRLLEAAAARPADLQWGEEEGAGVQSITPGRQAARTTPELFQRGLSPQDYYLAEQYAPKAVGSLGLMTPEAAETKGYELAQKKRIEGLEQKLETIDRAKDPEGFKNAVYALAVAKGDLTKLIEELGIQSPEAVLETARKLQGQPGMEGTRVQPKVSERGRVSATIEADSPSVDRELFELAKEKFPKDRDAQVTWINKQKAAQAGRVAGQQAAAAAAHRPLDAADRQAINVHNQILASVAQLQAFTPEEISAFTGLLQRPAKDVAQILKGLPVIGGAFGKPDQRFAEFKALMGRLEGTAFGEGGKQLTGTELRVVTNYTPTGREPGGATEMLAKAKNLEAFTRVSRALRVQLAKEGKAEIDPDEYDRLLKVEMQKAGLPLPGAPAKGAPKEGAADTGVDRVRRANQEAQQRHGKPFGALDEATAQKLWDELYPGASGR